MIPSNDLSLRVHSAQLNKVTSIATEQQNPVSDDTFINELSNEFKTCLGGDEFRPINQYDNLLNMLSEFKVLSYTHFKSGNYTLRFDYVFFIRRVMSR
ncbi:TPA: hypothetical protein JLK53_001937 [Escherichia coli]|nr:hypothetical protein [Escherichia coli]